MLKVYFPDKTKVPDVEFDLYAPESGLHSQDVFRLADKLLEIGQLTDLSVVSYSPLLLTRILRRTAEDPDLRKHYKLFYCGDVIEELVVDDNGLLENAPEGFMEEEYQEVIKHARVIERRSESDG